MDASMPPDQNNVLLPGGTAGAWAIAGCGLLATIIAMALVFVPPSGTTNVLNYEANLIGQAAVLLGIGFALYFTARRRSG